MIVQKKLLLIIVFVLVGLISSAAFALDPMGPPKAGLQKGKFGLGAEYSHTRMKIKMHGHESEAIYVLEGLSSETSRKVARFKVKVDMDKVYGNIGYGITDDWEIFVRLGGMNADWSERLFPIASTASARDYHGDTGFAYGFGTKKTFYSKDKLEIGALFQISWAQSTARFHGIRDGEAVLETAKLKLTEMQIALGPTYHLTEKVSIYGGPFWHFANLGSSDISSSRNIGDPSQDYYKITKSSFDVDDLNHFGLYIGSEVKLTKSAFYCIEYQHTPSADALAMNLIWKF
jgi:hypothetical protein